jgi:hypothetical protein
VTAATPAQRTKLARRAKLASMFATDDVVIKTHKYRAKATTCSANHRHPSMKEANRCAELRLLEKGGEIVDLQFQPRYALEVNGLKICSYIGDFFYRDARTEAEVLEDCKGVLTPVYRLKKKLLKAIRGIEITET